MVALWIILAAASGLTLGALLGYLFAARRCGGLAGQLQASQQNTSDRDAQIQQLRSELDALRLRLGEAQLNAGQLHTELVKERESFVEQKRLLLEAESRLKDAFAGASQEALLKNNESFLDLAKSRFEPMKTLLEQYQARLAEMEQSRTSSHSDIREQLGSVAEAHRQLSTRTAQLVSALTSPGTRGRWGEIGLERVLQLSGMTSGIHYDAQQTFSGEDGRSRPDVCVNLPGGKCIIIDSKYPGTHFFKALECEDAAAREGLLRQYVQAVRGHANGLRSREYWRKVEGSPEFVVMYLSGEAMLYAAVQADASLLEDMFADRVIIATPTTLMALLKAIAYGWQEAQVEKNIEQVRALGAQIVERTAMFADHFNKVGRSLDSANQSFNQAAGSLESRLLVTARKMKELGVSSAEVPEIQPIDTAARQLSDRVSMFDGESRSARATDDALV